jgi:alpha-tubulin suppressor-like RCC1 family protein
VGELHTCALGSDGSVSCWGSNVVGQLGFPSEPGAAANVEQPRRVSIPAARSISSGPRHTCAVLIDGTVRCWGANERGQCGGGSTGGPVAPVAVRWLDHAVELAAGDDHTCARLASGEVRCWGATDYGVMGR